MNKGNNKAVDESEQVYQYTEGDMTDVNLVKVLEERVDQGNNNHSIEDTYFKKIEELLSVKNKEMEDKLNQQHE